MDNDYEPESEPIYIEIDGIKLNADVEDARWSVSVDLPSTNADAVYDLYVNIPPRTADKLSDASVTLELEYVGTTEQYEWMQRNYFTRVMRSIRAWLYALIYRN